MTWMHIQNAWTNFMFKIDRLRGVTRYRTLRQRGVSSADEYWALKSSGSGSYTVGPLKSNGSGAQGPFFNDITPQKEPPQ